MNSGVARILASARTGWILFAVALAAFVFVYLNPFDWRFGEFNLNKKEDYAAATERLFAQDRANPLRMRLEGQYPGPLQDTTIERWRDPVDGTVCYIFLPIAVPHEPGPNGYVQYGAANIGSMSCFRGN